MRNLHGTIRSSSSSSFQVRKGRLPNRNRYLGRLRCQCVNDHWTVANVFQAELDTWLVVLKSQSGIQDPEMALPLTAALAHTYGDVRRNHTLQMAAALSYYFVLSLFPALIFLSAVVAYLPVPNLFDQALSLMARFLPPDSMGLVRRVLADVITPNRSAFLSFGLLGTLWAASGGFSAAIEALNIAYDVEDDRPFWKTRPLAIGLALMTGFLMLLALSVMIVGPRFGEWLAARVHLSNLFVLLWPLIHWSIAVGFTVLAVEALYFLGPNIKQRFLATLPGAVLAVGCWLALSYLLGLYFRHFANFNKTYGTMGAAIALMTWLYWTGFAMLLGAELNAELAKISKQGRIEEKRQPPAITRIDIAA
jgi:membrane protein